MALITCPECGKERISDCAELCPSCGYPIRKRFEEIKEQEIKKRNYQRKLDSIKMPVKPQKPRMGVAGWIYIVVLIIISMFVFMIEVEMVIIPLFWGGLIFVILYYVFVLEDYFKAIKQYKNDTQRATEDFEKYKREELRRRENERMSSPKCPVCNSRYIVKISTTSRVASVLMIGIASGKIGKQYKCTECGHMW